MHEGWGRARIARDAGSDALLDQRAADLPLVARRRGGWLAHGAGGNRGEAFLSVRAAELGRRACGDRGARVGGRDALLGERAADLPLVARRRILGAAETGRGQACLGVWAAELGVCARPIFGDLKRLE